MLTFQLICFIAVIVAVTLLTSRVIPVLYPKKPVKVKHPIYATGDKVWHVLYGGEALMAKIVGVGDSGYLMQLRSGSTFFVSFDEADKKLIERIETEN